MTTMKSDKPAEKRPRKMAREPKPQQVEVPQGNGKTPIEPTTSAAPSAPSTAKTTTKTAVVIDLLARPEGATLEQMIAATGWLPHTTRAALTGLKKKGHGLTSVNTDGVRTYRVTPVQSNDAKLSGETESKPEA